MFLQTLENDVFQQGFSNIAITLLSRNGKKITRPQVMELIGFIGNIFSYVLLNCQMA
jgi:hypothetical protein